VADKNGFIERKEGLKDGPKAEKYDKNFSYKSIDFFK
jgi:hypothetical protein